MTTPIPPSLERFGAELNRAAHRELSTKSKSARTRVPRPRLIAGGTLGLAGIGAALVLALSAGGAAAPPAFAVTRSSDGSVLVKLSYASDQNLPQVNAKLAAMGTHEQISIRMGTGAASVSGPVTCTRTPSASGPVVRVLNGSNGTEVISAGESAGNTAEGTFHLVSCVVTGDTGSGNSGNTGNG
ncbi:MAG TPA: hypothetical protein VMF57_21760 [Solirubrobacteraceae bacterium]|nr:hypothetical protein [Solirubrobacteraceae bacterium]